MRSIVSCIFLLFLISAVRGQELRTDISYAYMYASEWDKAIQVYNFSRPFLQEKQPLLIHGMQSSVAKIWASDAAIRHGLDLSYAQFRSVSRESQFRNVLHLHFMKLGYILQYVPNRMKGRVYSELQAGVVSSLLFRNLEGSAFQIDERGIRAMGVGGECGIKTGYYAMRSARHAVSIHMQLRCMPYVYAPGMEGILNQTRGVSSRAGSSVWILQGGIAVHFLSGKKN